MYVPHEKSHCSTAIVRIPFLIYPLRFGLAHHVTTVTHETKMGQRGELPPSAVEHGPLIVDVYKKPYRKRVVLIF
jgi:hypothetical protein